MWGRAQREATRCSMSDCGHNLGEGPDQNQDFIFLSSVLDYVRLLTTQVEYSHEKYADRQTDRRSSVYTYA